MLPFHRAVIDHPDFVGAEGFKVHTRWIESDFATPLAAAVRAAPVADTSLLRTAIEIDGRRVQLGLPAVLLQGLAAAGGKGLNVTLPHKEHLVRFVRETECNFTVLNYDFLWTSYRSFCHI